MNSKKLIQFVVLFVIGIVSSATLYAQTNVSGTVTDEDGKPVAGVAVLIPGTTHGTSTDINGKYTINPGNSESLEYSCIGYKTQTIRIGGQAIIEVIMEEDTTLLDETVVVGYGVQKKVNLTGAISVVDSKDLENRASFNVSNMLQGAIPGLVVKTNRGYPGATSSINVRGYTSINGGEPLVLIDGAEGDINYVNPNDIESISVIKDASAAAVYGGRAAFGVILVNTKTPNASTRPRVQLSARYGWNDNTTSTDFETTGFWSVYTIQKFWNARTGSNYIEYTDADYAQMLARVHDKTEDPSRPWVVVDNRDGYDQWIYYGNTDWWNTIFRNQRPRESYDISVSGGGNGVRYLLSGGYEQENGLIRDYPDIYKKWNLRARLDFDVNKWLSFNNTTTLYSAKSTNGVSGADNTLGYMSRHLLPIFPGDSKNPDGSWLYMLPYMGDQKPGNARQIFMSDPKWRRVERDFDLSNTTGMKITFLPSLTLNGDFTYRRREYEKLERFYPLTYRQYPDGPEEVYTSGVGTNERDETFDKYEWYTANGYITYDDTYNNAHHLTITGGVNYEYYYTKEDSMWKEDVSSEELSDFALATGSMSIKGGSEHWALFGYFLRVNYDFKGRYLFEASARYDGTSRFAKGNRWGLFPSASAGWRISEEPFFQPASKVVDNLKLRFSFGSLGNQNVDTYSYLRLISTGTLGYTFNEGEGSTGPSYSSLGDPVASDLTWETVQQYDVGVDLAMFQNRLTFTADAYIRNTLGMLTSGVDLPSVYGASVPKINAANLSTQGYEFQIEWRDSRMLGGRLFEYSVGGNLSDNACWITKFDNPTKILSSWYKGERYGEIWGYKTDGFFQTQEEVDEYVSKVDASNFSNSDGIHVGDLKYVDLNGDGVISNGSNTKDDHGDMVVLGNSDVSFQYGFNASVSYFGFDVSVFFQGVGNVYRYPQSYEMNFWGCYAEEFVSFLQKDFLTRCWSEDNPNAYFPRPYGQSAISGSLSHTNDRYLQNCRYLRLKNLTVGYTIPAKVTRKASIEKIRVYFTGENLAYWSPLKKTSKNYMDPEQMINTSYESKSDCISYPWAKTMMFGIDITF